MQGPERLPGRSASARSRWRSNSSPARASAAPSRVIKVSEIARSASQQSLSRSHEMRKELQTARDAASRAARRGAAAADKARRLKAQNAELRQRVGALEDLAARVGALEAAGTSASMRAFLDTARVGLY
jgi:hypothetical protein